MSLTLFYGAGQNNFHVKIKFGVRHFVVEVETYDKRLH